MQTAVKLVIEPIFEADLEPNAYGYRPKPSEWAACTGRSGGFSPWGLVYCIPAAPPFR